MSGLRRKIGVAGIVLVLAVIGSAFALLFHDTHERHQAQSRADHALAVTVRQFNASLTDRLRHGAISGRQLSSLQMSFALHGLGADYTGGVNSLSARIAGGHVQVTFQSNGAYSGDQGALASGCYRVDIAGTRSAPRSTATEISCTRLLPELAPTASVGLAG
jgi:hypothetical protein